MAVLSEKLGVSKEVFQKELEESRRELERRLDAEHEEKERLKAQAQMLRGQLEQLQSQDTGRREEHQKLRERLETLESQSRVIPGERDKLQKEKELLQAEMERHREERENEQRMNRLQMQQLEEKQAEVQALMDQAASRARNYNFPSGVTSLDAFQHHLQQRCLHPRKRRWANGHGRGVKCVDCKKDL